MLIFPDAFIKSKSVPVSKKGDSSLLNNYRPISILPAISKIFERVIYNQLYEYFNSNNLLTEEQYGSIFLKIYFIYVYCYYYSSSCISLYYVRRVSRGGPRGLCRPPPPLEIEK